MDRPLTHDLNDRADRIMSELLELPQSAFRGLDEDIAAAGGALEPDPRLEGAFGFTMFDAPSSEDNRVTVLLSDAHIGDVPSQALVRIRSKDGRDYLGTVVAGPFAEPDGLRADSSVLVTIVTRGGIFVPPFHGRVLVELLGEETEGAIVPPRHRPLPNSPVFVLDELETASKLQVAGDIQLGRVIGLESVSFGVPSDRKDVLPRHMAILGTTGGGKSTTVARLVQQAQTAGCAVILLDVEGEYTFLHQATSDARMHACTT
jgi:DNA helicase HerA-like ATPase